ncbi:MAG: hypothetical protein Q7I95_07610 [Thiobacillus sp.]|nr:hypothetical protein [Thiobacillus sp.]
MTGPAPAEPVAWPYSGRRVALLTQHGKEGVIAPVLDAALGYRVERVGGFDTDALGTFTRDIPRAGNQTEAARRKARIGMELSGLPLGLASEGAFGPDPMAGLFPWNVELLLFIDDERGIEVTGMAQQATRFAHLLTDDWEAAVQFARQAGFPEHHLVVRPQGQDDPRIEKGLASWTALETAFNWARGLAENGRAFLEHDLRAHAHPTRRDVIRLAAVDLAAKLNSLCPACGAPGFWIVERLPGLPCADCGAPTREIRADIHGCLKCARRETREHTDVEHADPGRCDYCNP